jgi:hypothetical protein
MAFIEGYLISSRFLMDTEYRGGFPADGEANYRRCRVLRERRLVRHHECVSRYSIQSCALAIP